MIVSAAATSRRRTACTNSRCSRAPRWPISGSALCASFSDMSSGPWKLCTSISIAGLCVQAATRTWNSADISIV